MPDKPMTLLDKAHAVNKVRSGPRKRNDEEMAELLFAWLKGDVDSGQFAAALNMKSRQNISPYVGSAIRACYESGTLLVSLPPKEGK